MAFAAAGLNCIAVGPTKLYIYNTEDTLTTATLLTTFNTANCPGMSAGDIVMVADNTNAALCVIRITAIDAATCTYVDDTALL